MIRVFEPKLSIKDKFSVLKAVSQNEISGSSKYVNKFEKKEFANLNNMNFAVAVSNGSVALDVALQLLSLKKGDEVIVPSHTIISCLSAIIRAGTPVFCDVDSTTWNMTLKNVQEKFSINTKAVLAVHTYGLLAEISKFRIFVKDSLFN